MRAGQLPNFPSSACLGKVEKGQRLSQGCSEDEGVIYVPDTSVAHCYPFDPSGPARVDGGGLSVSLITAFAVWFCMLTPALVKLFFLRFEVISLEN